jgi:hypothetical protein
MLTRAEARIERARDFLIQMFAWHQSQIAHESSRMRKTPQIAEFGNDSRRGIADRKSIPRSLMRALIIG